MLGVIFLFALALVWISLATLQDIKKREVANWLNFSLIIFALGFRFFYDLFYSTNFNFFYQGLIGLGIFFVLGNLFYYGRMFAGGDAKLMISLGTILPLSNNFTENLSIFSIFLLLFFFIGALYGLAISLFLTITNFNKFKKEISKQFNYRKNFTLIILFIALIIFSLGFLNRLFFIFGSMLFILPYLYIYAKAIDKSCMIKNIPTNKLTEGDWLYQDVKVGREIIKSNWDGLTKLQIEKIQKKFKKIKIRQGIPFIPVFLISFIIFIGLHQFGFLDNLWNSFW